MFEIIRPISHWGILGCVLEHTCGQYFAKQRGFLGENVMVLIPDIHSLANYYTERYTQEDPC